MASIPKVALVTAKSMVVTAAVSLILTFGPGRLFVPRGEVFIYWRERSCVNHFGEPKVHRVTETSQEAKRLGRPPKWAERTPIRFAEGTFCRIAAVLVPHEDRSDFIRSAVERELERREAVRP